MNEKDEIDDLRHAARALASDLARLASAVRSHAAAVPCPHKREALLTSAHSAATAAKWMLDNLANDTMTPLPRD